MAIFNLNFLLKVGQVEMCQNPSPISTAVRLFPAPLHKCVRPSYRYIVNRFEKNARSGQYKSYDKYNYLIFIATPPTPHRTEGLNGADHKMVYKI